MMMVMLVMMGVMGAMVVMIEEKVKFIIVTILLSSLALPLCSSLSS